MDVGCVARPGLITVEGIEGAGKSTQVARLAAWLRGRGLQVVATAEPDGTPVGAALRGWLAATAPVDPLTEAFLFAAARAEHVRRVVRPALERGVLVISDRYSDSTVAYQGYGRGVPLDVVAMLNHVATNGLTPDLTIVLDLDAAEGLRRAQGRPAGLRTDDPFERLGLEFHERVRKGYRAIQEREPARVVLIRGDQPADSVFAAIRAVVAARLGLGDAA